MSAARTRKFYRLSTFDSQLMYLTETTAIAESLRGDWIPADNDAARGGEVASRWFLYYRLKRCHIVSSTISALNCFQFRVSHTWYVLDYSQTASFIFIVLFYCYITMHTSESFSGPDCIDNALSVILCHYGTLWFISRQSTHASLLCAYTATVNARSNIMWCKSEIHFTLWTQSHRCCRSCRTH